MAADAGTGLDLRGHPFELRLEGGVVEPRVGGVTLDDGRLRRVGALGANDVAAAVVCEVAARFGAGRNGGVGADGVALRGGVAGYRRAADKTGLDEDTAGQRLRKRETLGGDDALRRLS